MTTAVDDVFKRFIREYERNAGHPSKTNHSPRQWAGVIIKLWGNLVEAALYQSNFPSGILDRRSTRMDAVQLACVVATVVVEIHKVPFDEVMKWARGRLETPPLVVAEALTHSINMGTTVAEVSSQLSDGECPRGVLMLLLEESLEAAIMAQAHHLNLTSGDDRENNYG